MQDPRELDAGDQAAESGQDNRREIDPEAEEDQQETV
jgi:hypothetical protein